MFDVIMPHRLWRTGDNFRWRHCGQRPAPCLARRHTESILKPALQTSIVRCRRVLCWASIQLCRWVLCYNTSIFTSTVLGEYFAPRQAASTVLDNATQVLCWASIVESAPQPVSTRCFWLVPHCATSCHRHFLSYFWDTPGPVTATPSSN